MSMSEIFEVLQKLDSELYYYIDEFGIYIYLLLFLIVFGKTGFVILSFLPGDSLLFASGAIAAVGELNLVLLFPLLFVATSLADSNNFLLGRVFKKIPADKNYLKRMISQSSIEKASDFLNEYEKVAITFSRFIPLMRTMIPFIAGFTDHSYINFVRYNVLGALIWTLIWLGTGFGLGNIPWVEENLLFTLALITVIMFIPSIYGFLAHFHKKNIAITKNSES
ncbi:VTT domain-containing protein [Ureibacillus aquaedulcis]|uniref:VTT domain-containing protein n=1 Tax=Ureibacillus aquaedulcis TaxID=3058421 RepID=A0ABT8GPS4_9BACL|nr:VTT domain-containing protein [Ureibacillus sp. BA0131]MDN4493410.1 VTT domain-containing protein [Ureibacillus sp. BA0131]